MTSRADFVRAGDELARQGRWDEYAALARRAHKQFPQDAVLAVRYGQSLVDRFPAEAWHQVERAVALAPDDPHVLVRAAMALVDLGGYAQAKKLVPRAAQALVQRGADRGPDALVLLHVQGRIAVAEGDTDVAERNLRVAFEGLPDEQGIAPELARLYCRQGRLDEARDVIDRGREHAPEDEQLQALDQWLTGLRRREA